MGTPAPAAASLARLVADGHEIAAVYTQPDRPAGRGNRTAASPVKELASSRGIPVLQPGSVRTPEALAALREFDAEAVIVVAFGRILPAGFLEAFRYGAVNLHFSLLPKYRGAAPVNWAIVNGETETGVTTMRMDEGLDTGDILLQARTPIGADETAVELMARLSEMGAGLLSETLAQIGSIRPVQQDDASATLAPLMTKEMGKIDWALPAGRIRDRIRGFQPFPTSYSFLDDRKLTFWRAVAGAGGSEALPGTVVGSGSGELRIACGGGTELDVQELQIEGKRRMPVRDFLNGVAIPAGTVLR